MAAIAPGRCLAASAIARPRSRTSPIAAPVSSEPAAARAANSPTECPTTTSGSSPRSRIAARIARLVATSAGCCTSVSTSSSSGVVKQSASRSRPVTSEPIRYTSRAAGKASAISRPMPSSSDPCPGKQNATLLMSLSPVRPFDESRAPGEARAHAGEQYQLAGLQPSICARIRERERDGPGRCVAVAIDVHDGLLGGDTELSRRVVDDPLVRLVRYVHVDVVDGLAALGEDLVGGRNH